MTIQEATKKIKSIRKPTQLKIPLNLVFELNTERDDIELLGRVKIVEVKKGNLIDEDGEFWKVQDLYPKSDIMNIYNSILKHINIRKH